jgi:hypothetical protein
MNPESLRRVIAEMFAEWKAKEEAEKAFELEMSNWYGNNI